MLLWPFGRVSRAAWLSCFAESLRVLGSFLEASLRLYSTCTSADRVPALMHERYYVRSACSWNSMPMGILLGGPAEATYFGLHDNGVHRCCSLGRLPSCRVGLVVRGQKGVGC